MRKSIILMTAIFTFFFSTGTASAFYLLDLTPPKIESFWMNKDVINQGEVGLFVKAVDTASGVKKASIVLKHAGTGEQRTVNLQGIGGDIWTGNLVIGPNDAEGVWTIVQITATDGWNNTAKATSYVTIMVDKTPPASPIVNEVTDQSVKLMGTAEANSTIIVKKNGQILANSAADINGLFSIQISKQEPGSELYVTAVDKAGNESAPAKVIVKDITKPEAPVINETLTEDTTVVHGKAEYKTTVKAIWNGTVIASTTNVQSNGDFTLTLPKNNLIGGRVIEFTATDAAGNESDPLRLTVQDATPPGVPTVNMVTDQSTAVTGKADRGDKILVKANGQVIGTAYASDVNGDFSVAIPKQKGGTQLVIIAVDGAGNESTPVTVTVKDLSNPDKPVVTHEITDKTTQIIGKAEVGTTVKITANDKVIASQKVVNGDGSFTITINPLVGITEIKIIATDAAGNESEPLVKMVKDVTAPEVPVLTETITDQSTLIKGKAEAHSTVVITYNEKYTIGNIQVGEEGIFTYSIPKMPVGATLSFKAIDAAGNESQLLVVYIGLQITFPTPGAPKTFSDIDSVPWAKPAIEAMATLGVINGVSDKEFAPKSNVTRAEFAKMIVKTLGLKGENLNNPFEDVEEGKWYYNDVLLAAKYGIVKGVSPVEFAPNQKITRQEMAVMVVRAMNLVQPVKANDVEGTLKKFTDRNQIADWARESMAIAVEKGLISGMTSTTMEPGANTTRAQSAVIIYRFYNLYN